MYFTLKFKINAISKFLSFPYSFPEGVYIIYNCIKYEQKWVGYSSILDRFGNFLVSLKVTTESYDKTEFNDFPQ